MSLCRLCPGNSPLKENFSEGQLIKESFYRYLSIYLFSGAGTGGGSEASLETVPAVWGVQRPDSGTRAAYTQALAKEP